MEYSDKQLVILMAGKGTRLYPLTLGFPKCLLSIKQKPAIYNMILPLINKGLKDIIFVVNQENLSLIKDFMNTSFFNLELNIKYVIQTDFSGPGNAFSLVAKHIDKSKSVILLLGDTLCSYPDNYNNSWIGVTSVDNDEKKNYCMIVSEYKLINDIINKPKYNVETNDAAIGLYYFKNAELLSNVLENQIDKINGEYQLSSYFDKYREEDKLYIEKIDNWKDIGTLDGYLKANKNSFNCRFFNKLDLDEYSVLHKKSKYEKVTSEMNWFKETRDTDFVKMIPKFYESETTSDEYGIEYYDYLTLSEYFTFYPLSQHSRTYIFNSLIDKMIKLYKNNKVSNKSFENLLKQILWDKTLNRINEWERKDLISLEEVKINNQKYLGVFQTLEKLKGAITKLSNECSDYISIIHGDPAFSNILFSPRNMIYKFIDPRGNFGIDTIYGDYRYDLAKLRHCYHGRYDEITNDLFTIQECEGKISIKFYKNIEYDNFDEILRKKNIDIDDIELIEGLLFISMIPLHNDYPQRQIAFFTRGIQILNNQLVRRNLNE